MASVFIGVKVRSRGRSILVVSCLLEKWKDSVREKTSATSVLLKKKESKPRHVRRRNI